nr:uncharacterized protein LOC111512499 isoform X1 [Leptinotarsa decemlineata]
MCWLRILASAVIFFVGVQKAHSIRCYSCFSKDIHDDCAVPDKSQISLVKCDMTTLERTKEFAKGIDPSYNKLFEVDNIETEAGRIGLACLKMVTKVGNKSFFLRGCQLAEQGNLDICRKVHETSNENVKNLHCSKCTTEGCNSSTKYTTNPFSVVLFTTACRLLQMSLY